MVLENASYNTVTNSSDPLHYMPNLVALGTKYGHATNYFTNSGGSLLAYLWLSSGYCHSDPNSTADCPHPPFPAGVTGLHSFGCTGGACINPATQDFWPITDDNIYREMFNHLPSPIAWKLYAESLPFPGYTGPRPNPPDPNSAYPAELVIVERIVHEAVVNGIQEPQTGFRLQPAEHVPPSQEAFLREEIELL